MKVKSTLLANKFAFRLQEYCEKLMFSWPLEYGRKVEEVIWRKGFYDVIQLVKRNIKVC